MPTRAQAQFGKRGTQFRRDTHGMDIRGIGTIVPKNFQWHVKLMACRVARQALDQIGNRFEPRPPPRQHRQAQSPGQQGCALRIRRSCLRSRPRKLEAPQGLPSAHRRCRNGALRSVRPGAREPNHGATIVSSNAAATGWAAASPVRSPISTSRHHCSRISPGIGSRANSRMRETSALKAYSAKSASRTRCRREQRGKIAVAVDLPHERSTMFEMTLHETQSSDVHATAMSPAPTRRFSASKML